MDQQNQLLNPSILLGELAVQGVVASFANIHDAPTTRFTLMMPRT
jgi:hypothetical protein